MPDDAPGLGIELNDEVLKQRLHKEDPGYLLRPPEWNQMRSYERLWT